ncbi:ATP-dependent DNA ligase [Streptomyces angustmyceticus]|uniref:ATP-dependent DNA ligase n=1 Tax=Streptomyces angustmyceticus TaxID=285578 RepID=UPI00344B0FA9
MPLRLPVTVALAEAATDLPSGPGWAYEPKFDGHRVIVARPAEGRARLQAGRSHRSVTTSFPDLAQAAERLPPGTVLDGEAVIYQEGHVDFTAVQQRALSSPIRARLLASQLPASYAAFDALAVEGEDLRARPYKERRVRLLAVLEPLGPPLQAVPSTTSREEALEWLEALRGQGIEGIVAKRTSGRYPAGRRAWVKVRHTRAQDALAVGFTGSASRPKRAVVDVGGGRLLLSTPLDVALSRLLAQALEVAGDAAGGVEWLRDGTQYQVLRQVMPVEVEVGTTRHRHVTVRRLRPDLG